MAIKSKAQIQAESNNTYQDNSVGSITPTSVRSLNTDWIDSIIFAEATASLTVFGATSASFAVTSSNALTASFLLGSVASSSFSQFAVSSSQATSASFASTASFVSGTIASASFATGDGERRALPYRGHDLTHRHGSISGCGGNAPGIPQT